MDYHRSDSEDRVMIKWCCSCFLEFEEMIAVNLVYKYLLPRYGQPAKPRHNFRCTAIQNADVKSSNMRYTKKRGVSSRRRALPHYTKTSGTENLCLNMNQNSFINI